MRISELLQTSLIKVGLEAADKEDVFEEMLDLFIDNGLVQDREAALQALFEREAKMSTGIAKWLALPHGKLEEARSLMMAMGVSKKGIDYDSLNGEPVYVVLMVFAQIGNPGPHIEALAEVSRLFSIPGFISEIRFAETAEDVLDFIRKEEQ